MLYQQERVKKLSVVDHTQMGYFKVLSILSIKV